MSFGKMNTFIDIISTTPIKDSEGFTNKGDTVLATIRAYREGRHGSVKWANMAQFSEATDLFRFRAIPDLEIKTDMVLVCDGGRFEITSVENIKGKGMYTEVLAKAVIPSG